MKTFLIFNPSTQTRMQAVSTQTTKRVVKRKEIFLLKDVEPYKVELKYGLQTKVDNPQTIIPMETTLLNPKTEFFSFLDESRKFCLTMRDSITHGEITSKMCFWCRHSFETIPIGCPMKYVSSTIMKTCQSETVTDDVKETYVIEQEIPIQYLADISDIAVGTIHPKDYYETEGSFCSFNCCMAYINDHVRDSRYSNSKSLLGKMYLTSFNRVEKIHPAPDWKLLQAYGGPLTLAEFKTAGNYLYIDKSHPVANIPKVSPMGRIYEQIYVF